VSVWALEYVKQCFHTFKNAFAQGHGMTMSSVFETNSSQIKITQKASNKAEK